jgi:hypothetical protein
MARANVPERRWLLGASAALAVILMLTAFEFVSLHCTVRPIGFRGRVRVPGREVTVQFKGGSYIEISNAAGSSSCSIGHYS